ncbi:MAG: 3-oxoacyl-[acyl-carrier-protein] reductase [Deltaproteobacteria bacterium]|nr:3-oxoacyl-[acyl-carrier-protein] reductase [Deltaproteobacteria bacterium]
MKLKDRVAIVTGASGGIGQAIAKALAAEGATVVCHYANNKERAEAVVAQIEDAGGAAIKYQCDIRDFSQAEKMAQDIIEKYDRVDILVNNAGINRDELIMMMTPEDWQAVIDTNLTGPFNCVKAVAQQMTFQKFGRIINISSVAGDRGGRGQSNYAASKGGLNAFTRAAAVELARKKVTVNALAPGVIETEMSQEVLRRAKEIVMNHIPLKRLGLAEEVAQTVVFLASEAAAYITGQVINVDGGFRG